MVKTKSLGMFGIDQFGQDVGKIRAIISADGWFAQYRNEDGSLLECAVTFWALADELTDNHVTVVGMDMEEGYPSTCSGAANFLRYVHQNQLGVDPDDVG